MSYQTAKNIKEVINSIKKKKYVLPSIQREFVWSTTQIENLFDSLMRNYPISTFLFWKVEKENVSDFQFYDFLKDYHEKNSSHNNKLELDNNQDITAILDGQQRLTSLYIGLCGSYSKKMPYLRWDSENAFPAKKLYLNLLSQSDDSEKEYDFKFLTKDESLEQGYSKFWFEVSQILTFKDSSEAMLYFISKGLTDASALKSISHLYHVINEKGTINYYEETSKELDKVLQIFIRINSGGTKLSYSDLLLSIATAQWKDRDARDVIHQFVDEINSIGRVGFSFNKDFVLKSCLVLGDFSNIKFKVDNFTKENMLKIEQLWGKISYAIKLSVKLIDKFNFNRDNLTSTNAIIPIAYFLLKNNCEEEILHLPSYASDRKQIREWLIRVLLKGTFGGQPDSVYPIMRDVINDNIGEFPLSQIVEKFRGKIKSISFSDDDIENLLDLEYGNARTYCILSLLYYSRNENYRYHQDHIHPQKYFSNTQLTTEEIVDKQSYLKNFNRIANLQLMQETENAEKSGKHFLNWLNETFANDSDKKNFLQQNYISLDSKLEFINFIDFYSNRRSNIKLKLESILGNVSQN